MGEIGNAAEQRTFVVRILNRQNATWQGLVTHVDQKEEQPFRSLLELIKLIDSTFDETEGETLSAETKAEE
ncbi:MAG: hypothetical protein LBE16_04075 [Clostridiales Family XIII bacterium]|jgi:hypothetical protein|nr:hypothetical protein [Clostridiales Family XIII bacterium]